MADGSTKDIEDVRVGDRVLATDPETGRTGSQPVLATITSEGDKNLVQITINTGAPLRFRVTGDEPVPATHQRVHNLTIANLHTYFANPGP